MQTEGERLHKYMARCGVASLRKSEVLIKAGAVSVNGKTISELGYKIKPGDIVSVKGKVISPEEKIYLLLNKPRGVICSVHDEKGRKTVISLLPKALQEERLYPVGRLDYDTKGVLLLTNDGGLTHLLIGPRSNVEKEYLARVEGIIKKEELTALRNGVILDDGYLTKKCQVKILAIDNKNRSTLLDIVLTEGKNHEIKRMVAAVGHPLKKLTRIRFADLTLAGLKEGECRSLKRHEVKVLYSKK